MWLKALKTRLFFKPINQDQFSGSNAKVWVTYTIDANIAMIISDFQQKYAVKSHKKIWWHIKKFINEKVEIKSVRFISNKSLLG